MQLTDREIKIIYLLLNRTNPITAKELSDKYGVSVRTIKYDLKDLKEWFSKENNIFQTKPHVGIWIKDEDEARQKVRDRLIGQTDFEYYAEPEKRVLQIVFLLSLTDQAVTLQQLQNKLNVSESTMLNDLEKVKNKMKPFSIYLSHKDFYGYMLSGSELSIRSFMEKSIQDVISRFDIFSVIRLLKMNSTEVTGLLLGINNEFEYILKKVLTCASQLLNKDDSKLDYNDILTISCRLAISIARLSINNPINSYQEIKLESDSFDFQLFKQAFHEYDFPLYEDEYQYVINGGQNQYKDDNLVVLTKQIINSVSTEVEQPFNKDKQLFDSLLSHLMSRLNGKYQFTNEYNPFVKDIKENYPKLFKALYDVCISKISSNPLVVNDSFVSFLALHFMVSEQRIHSIQRKVSVVYVCSTGLGVTNLIQQKIEENIPNIEIAGFTSLIAAKKQINKIKPDLVISIFELSGVSSPVIQVSPLPTEQDLEKIKIKVANILSVDPKNMNRSNYSVSSMENFDSEYLKKFSRQMIMSMFSIYEDITNLLKDEINEKYKDALMLHIFMAIHRIEFNEQYEDQTLDDMGNDDLKEKIKKIFSQYKLDINNSETNAILEYINVSNNRGEKIDTK